MTTTLLNYFVMAQLSAFLLIFCRIGAAILVMPGFGESYVMPRIRLLFAVMFSVLLTPLLTDRMPPLASTPLGLLAQVLGELLIGIFIGMLGRTMLLAVNVAGNLIAAQSSLAVASLFDPNTNSQSPVVGNMLTLIAMTLFFALNIHHLVIAAIVQSYDMFAPGKFPMVADMNVLNIRLMADSFALGVMLSAPHIVYSLLFYLAGGLMARVMPTFQVFFIMMPPQIGFAILLLIAILPLMMDMFMKFMSIQFNNFLVPM